MNTGDRNPLHSRADTARAVCALECVTFATATVKLEWWILATRTLRDRYIYLSPLSVPMGFCKNGLNGSLGEIRIEEGSWTCLSQFVNRRLHNSIGFRYFGNDLHDSFARLFGYA